LLTKSIVPRLTAPGALVLFVPVIKVPKVFEKSVTPSSDCIIDQSVDTEAFTAAAVTPIQNHQYLN